MFHICVVWQCPLKLIPNCYEIQKHYKTLWNVCKPVWRFPLKESNVKCLCGSCFTKVNIICISRCECFKITRTHCSWMWPYIIFTATTFLSICCHGAALMVWPWPWLRLIFLLSTPPYNCDSYFYYPPSLMWTTSMRISTACVLWLWRSGKPLMLLLLCLSWDFRFPPQPPWRYF